MRWNSLDKRVGQEEVEHGCFIDDDGLGLQWVVFVVTELHGFGIKGQQAVDGFGFSPAHLGKALSRSPGWGCQQDGFAHGTPQGNDGLCSERLAAARSSRE